MTEASEEMERIQRECRDMVAQLKQLERQEDDLDRQNEILARELLICGFDTTVLEPAAPKRRKPAVKKEN